jgi:competence protein ComEC
MAFEAADSIVALGLKEQGRPISLSALSLESLLTLARASLELQKQNLVLWAPIFLLFGTWAYFQMGQEPSLWMSLAWGAVAVGLGALRSKSTVAVLFAVALTGFVVTKLRQEVVHTPMLRGATSGVIVGGYVADMDNRGNGRRELIVALEEATGIPQDEMPTRVRLAATNVDELQIGDYITFEAYLAPLPRPIIPGGFDYGRMLYFQSIGATGRILGEPSIEPRPVPWVYEYRRVFRGMRAYISERMTAVIPGAIGHLADAMVSGERAAIPADMNTSLQISGLAHIISISGLHMSMVAGGVFWAVRALLALVPFFALHWPIKKIAAVAALIVGFIYMLLADSGSATERSYIMIAVMFFAVLVDRPAFSMRNLALSAIIILLVTPEESVGASFQMSFLAVMGLGAFFAWWNSRERPHEVKKLSRGNLLLRRAGHVVVASTLTTLVAGGTSSIAAAYHFGRLSPFSIVANGITLPIMGALVMPPALLATLVMPFGLEYVPLKIMEFGLWLTMAVSDWVAAWPGANVLIHQPNILGTVLVFLGVTIFAIGIGRFRFLGIVVILIGLVITPLSASPTILVEDRAANVAVLNSNNEYVFANGEKNKFVGNKWLQHNGEEVAMAEAAQRPGWDCIEGDCFTSVAPMSVAFLHQERNAAASDYCPTSEIIIADYPLHFGCRQARLRIDRFDVWRNGAYAVYISAGRYTVETAKGMQGMRPWTYESRKSIKE